MRHLSRYTLVLLMMLAAACGSSQKEPPSPALKDCPGCNVVVILIDTLRADYLPMYGSSENTAPFLDSLSKRAVVFDRAFSASSWTAPATASIFTALYPSQHGVITGFAATKIMQKKNAEIQLNRLPRSAATMGEYMAKAGFRTIGVTDNINIGREIGFDRGFELFQKFEDDGAPKLARQADEFLQKVKGTRPYFLYLHLMDPHRPYHMRKPWFEQCVKSPNGTRQGRAICAYKSEIHYADAALEALAKKYGWLENSIVVVTADHGEEFWDHGGTGHGHSLYTEVLRVPLIIYHPSLRPRRVSENVQTTDILPTLVSFAGLPRDKRWKGKSLEGHLYGDPQASNPDREIVSERFGRVELPGPEFRSLLKGDSHYIQTGRFDEQQIEKKELFDLGRDFRELEDLLKSRPDRAAPLDARLSAVPLKAPVSDENETTSIKLDEDLVSKLQSLGYMN